jgi:hypothetical protein
LRLRFKARQVFLVLGTSDGKPKTATLRLNSEPIGGQGGKDVAKGKVTVDRQALYELVNRNDSREGQLDIIADSPGIEMYVFTFGD